MKHGVDRVRTASHNTTDTPDAGTLLKMSQDQGTLFLGEPGRLGIERERFLAGAAEAAGRTGRISSVAVDRFGSPQWGQAIETMP